MDSLTRQIAAVERVVAEKADHELARALAAIDNEEEDRELASALETEEVRGRFGHRSYSQEDLGRSRSRSRSRDRCGGPAVDSASGIGVECVICQKTMTQRSKRKELPCSGAHLFHAACIGRWFCRQRTCPVDREHV